MMRWSCCFAAIVLTVCAMAERTSAKPELAFEQKVQAPAGGANKPIEVGDGDVVLIEGDARVRIVRRREAHVRAIHDPEERWVILMVDYAPAKGKTPDGGVDVDYTFNEVGEWPLGESWTGPAVIDDYAIAGGPPAHGIGLTTEAGLIQVLATDDPGRFADPAAIRTVTYRGTGRGGGSGQSFAVVEPRLRAQASRNAQARSQIPGGAPVVSSSVEMRVGTAQTPIAPAVPPAADSAPVRVGGNVPQPTKVFDAPPVVPDAAVRDGVRGIVILEITIGPDGKVSAAKVLRSIPLLDQAAVDAVRQWRYTPTELNGVAVPVIMTVPVRF